MKCLFPLRIVLNESVLPGTAALGSNLIIAMREMIFDHFRVILDKISQSKPELFLSYGQILKKENNKT